MIDIPSSGPDDRFDFDEWMQLAARDPDAFEAKRRRLLERTIAAAPEKHRPRLQGLLWRLDRRRERSPNPMAACLEAYREMWDSVYGPDGLRDCLEHGGRPRRSPPARIIDLETGLDASRSAKRERAT